jgi:T5SS/PEP-CTERM-associated repeat protein
VSTTIDRARRWNGLSVLLVISAAFLRATEPGFGATSNWITSASGMYSVASNWDNGIPGANDTAVFRRGTGATYTVTFPGGNPLIQPPINTVTDRLIVGNNTVSFVEPFGRQATYTLGNTTTAEAGRGVIVGELGGVVQDVAVLNTALPITTAAATIGDGAGATGALNVNSSTFTVTGSDTANAALIVGNSGNGILNISAGAQLMLTGSSGNAILGHNAGASGTALVTGAGAKWPIANNLFVADSGTASLTIQNGGSVNQTGSDSNAVVAFESGSHGSATVDGVGSTWTIQSDLDLGRLGAGDLTISNGGTVSSLLDVDLGDGQGAVGTATVQGAGSALNVSDQLVLGGLGGSSLTVASGGQVHCANGLIGGGESAGAVVGSGGMTVTGAGSIWSVSGEADIGVLGHGTLTISSGGTVTDGQAQIAVNIGSVGNVMVNGSGSSWNNGVFLNVGGAGNATLTISAGGQVTSGKGSVGSINGGTGLATVTGAGSLWTITKQLTVGGSSGTLAIDLGGTVNVTQDTSIAAGGVVKLEGGAFRTSAISFQGNGQFQWTSGTLHVGIFNANLTNPNGGTLAPGNPTGSTVVIGSYTQQSGGAMEIEIGGLGQGSQFDFVNVTGSAIVQGQLDLKLIKGFLPSTGQTFLVFNAASLLGAFNNAGNGQRVSTEDGGGSFLVHYGVGSSFMPNEIVLSDFVANAERGDFNRDGQVTAADIPAMLVALADLNAYKTAHSLTDAQLAAIGDFDGSGSVNNLDIQGLLARLANQGGGAATPVPEPSSLVLLLLSALCLSVRQSFRLPHAQAVATQELNG